MNIIWKCDVCHYETEWSYEELVTHGTPVCPQCDIDLERKVTIKDVHSRDDNSYIVQLTPKEFQDMFDTIEREIQWCDKYENPQDYLDAVTLWVRLTEADKRHVCLDDELVVIKKDTKLSEK